MVPLHVAVHSIAYNPIPVVFMSAVGLATGLTVRIGTELTRSMKRAKRIAMWCMGFAAVVGVLVSLLLYWLRVPIIRLFVNDENVLQVSRRSRCCFCSGNARPQRVYFHSLRISGEECACLSLFSMYLPSIVPFCARWECSGVLRPSWWLAKEHAEILNLIVRV